ncbi:MAG: 50S ribosomal protein L16 [Candidatus Micrarchaeota archaeon]
MGIRPGRTITTPRRAWTRTAKTKVTRAYITGVPDSKMRRFTMGAAKIENCDIEATLFAGLTCQMRDNAMEAARVMANKVFEKKMLLENYFFRVRVYPHQCLRMNQMASGAGADRISSGMRLSFGTPCGRAVAVKKGQALMTVWSTKQYEADMKEGLKRAARKLPSGCTIKIKKLK